MKYVNNWEETKVRYEAWWNHSYIGRPMLYLAPNRKTPRWEMSRPEFPNDPSDFYMNPELRYNFYKGFINTHEFMGEAFPNIDTDLGPGSMALYLGCEPRFTRATVWFEAFKEDWEDKLEYDPNNKWLVHHKDYVRKLKELAGNDIMVNVPDIIENVDILSAMRGPQDFCYDLFDYPEQVHARLDEIDDLYFRYYDEFRDMVADEEDGISYTCFQIYGKGRTSKIQCDFSALMNPEQFREFVQPSLRKQCQRLEHTLYHLDGPDCIKHVDALMEIKELDAVQWTCGAGQPDGASERWYPLYDKIRAAGKSLWIQILDGNPNDWVEGCDKLVKRYGPEGMYFLIMTRMDEETAKAIIKKAETDWR